MNGQTTYDVVIVGAGISGAIVAKQLGAAGKRVLILEAGDAVPPDNAEYLERFYLAQAKVPEAPYTPALVTADAQGFQSPSNPTLQSTPRPSTLTLSPSNWNQQNAAYLEQAGPLAFSSTYERIGGGTMRHWLGTSLRFVPNDFRTKTQYGVQEDWPISYDQLEPWYGKAESEIGISANVDDQGYLGIEFPDGYQYPMPPIPNSLVDAAVDAAVKNVPPVDGIPLAVTNTPAGRNSVPYQSRRVCAGNTNCIPICPIQAKYDPTVTLNDALQYPTVEIRYKSVASDVQVDANGKVSAITYLTYENQGDKPSGQQTVNAKVFVIAAHAIETAKLLLMSANGGRTPNGVANSSGHLGQHLMDHPLYLCWALTPNPVYGYRGPLATAGIESLRDGAFRSKRAAFRIEIGNEGWNFAIGDPNTTAIDFIVGMNNSGLNPGKEPLFGDALTAKLNEVMTRQFRLGFLMEQTPDDNCVVSLSKDWKDALGLPRPHITYDFSHYTKMGFVAARKTGSSIYQTMGATEFTVQPTAADVGVDPTVFSVTYDAQGNEAQEGAPNTTTEYFRFFGAGHTVGTYRMGVNKTDSVVDAEQRSWDHPNLFLLGSGVFPTVTTANPTLTIAALTLWAAQTILQDLATA